MLSLLRVGAQPSNPQTCSLRTPSPRPAPALQPKRTMSGLFSGRDVGGRSDSTSRDARPRDDSRLFQDPARPAVSDLDPHSGQIVSIGS